MSTISTTQQSDISGMAFIAALPQWKRALWHDISVAAHTRNAFDNAEYDINGNLNPCSARFAELCTWLVCLTHFIPAVEQDHDKKLSRTDEHVGRLHDAPERTLKRSSQYGVASLIAVGN
jgi:hypothetical protein